jgi:hypothetical protein
MLQRFRREVLGLPRQRHWWPGFLLAEHAEIPITYCWSPALVPKPLDWGPNIDVVSGDTNPGTAECAASFSWHFMCQAWMLLRQGVSAGCQDIGSNEGMGTQ